MRRAAIFALVFFALGQSAVDAQTYPSREIKTIAPFAPGTGADIVTRFYASQLADLAGRPVVTENKPGAQGLLSTEAIARANADGYTIGIVPASSTLATAPSIFKKMPFDPVKDFDPIALLAWQNFVLLVDAKKGINTVDDLTRFLKERKGDSYYGGSTNTGIVASELYKKAIGVDVKRVNYRGINDAMNEIASGKIDFYFSDSTTAIAQTAAGRFKALAVTGSKRSAALPEVPTMTESGVEMDLSPWWGVVVPASVPQPVQDKLAGWFDQIRSSNQTKEFLKNAGLDVLPGDGNAMRALLVKDIQRWGEWARLANIEPQ